MHTLWHHTTPHHVETVMVYLVPNVLYWRWLRGSGEWISADSLTRLRNFANKYTVKHLGVAVCANGSLCVRVILYGSWVRILESVTLSFHCFEWRTASCIAALAMWGLNRCEHRITAVSTYCSGNVYTYAILYTSSYSTALPTAREINFFFTVIDNIFHPSFLLCFPTPNFLRSSFPPCFLPSLCPSLPLSSVPSLFHYLPPSLPLLSLPLPSLPPPFPPLAPLFLLLGLLGEYAEGLKHLMVRVSVTHTPYLEPIIDINVFIIKS